MRRPSSSIEVFNQPLVLLEIFKDDNKLVVFE